MGECCDYGLTRIVEPAEEPVGLAEMKAWLKQDVSDDDGLIGGLITAARQLLEQREAKAFITSTWRMTLECLPWEIELPVSPVQSIASITYVDLAGNVVTLPATDYVLVADGLTAEIEPAYQKVWPVPRYQPQSVTVTFVAGYGNAAAVPEPIKLAIKVAVAWWYERRGDEVESHPKALPAAVDALLLPYWDGRY